MRVKRGFKARRRRNRVLKLAKGFRGRRNGCYKRAIEAVERALMQSSRGRRVHRQARRGVEPPAKFHTRPRRANRRGLRLWGAVR